MVEEQLQVRNTDMQSLQGDLQDTKTQLSTAVSADEHEQTVIRSQQENMAQTAMLVEQHERALQERDAKHAKTFSQLKHACVVSQLQQEKQEQLELQLIQLQKEQSRLDDRDQQHKKDKDQLLNDKLEVVKELEEKCVVSQQQQQQQQQEKLQQILRQQEQQTLHERNHQQRQVKLLCEKIAEQRRCKDQLQHDKLVVVKELEEKCVRDVHAARVLHAKDLQQAIGSTSETYRKLQQEHQEHLDQLQHENLVVVKELEDKCVRNVMAAKELHVKDLQQAIVSTSETYRKLQQEQQEHLDQLQHENLVVVKELEDKCVRNVMAAKELHVKDLQQAIDKIAESDRKLLKAQEKMQLMEETHRQDLERAKEIYTKELQRREDDTKQVVQEQKEMKEEYTEELRKRDECHRQEREKLEVETTVPDAGRRGRRYSSHEAPTPKPFLPSSQVLDLEIVEPAIAGQRPKGRVRSADSKPRKRPSGNPNPAESPVNPNSSASSEASRRSSLHGSSSVQVVKPPAAKKARIFIESTGSDSDWALV